MADFEKITSIIASCYFKKDFPKKFYFYDNRREYKDRYRTGILKEQGSPKFFFKILHNNFYSKELEITKNLVPFFRIVPILFVKKYEDIFIHLYNYIDAHHLDGYAFLRNNQISYAIKKRSLYSYLSALKYQINKTLLLKKANFVNSSNQLFFNRLSSKGRAFSYYGTNYVYLLKDVDSIFPSLTKQIYTFIKKLNTLKNNNYLTYYAYTHGDLHDFNLSYDGVFWDLDTFDYNPITNDFSIFYWHFYAREDFLILKYNPWLSHYMINSLSPIKLRHIQQLKKSFIKNYYFFIKSIFPEKKFSIFKDELSLKIFSRSFLIDNVLTFNPSDRYLIYKYWYNYLTYYNSDSFFENVLFPQNSIQLNEF